MLVDGSVVVVYGGRNLRYRYFMQTSCQLDTPGTLKRSVNTGGNEQDIGSMQGTPEPEYKRGSWATARECYQLWGRDGGW